MIWYLISIAIGLTLFMIGLMIGNGKKNKELKLLLWKGIKAKERKDFNTAVINFTKAIELDPDFLDAYIFRAGIYSEQEKYAEAVEDYSKLIEIEPRNHIAYLNRGIANEHLKRFTESMADYTKAMKLSSNEQTNINFLRKGIYQRLKTPPYGYNEINNINSKVGKNSSLEGCGSPYGCSDTNLPPPIDKISFIERGRLLESQNDFHDATLSYTKAIELDPESKSPYQLRGNLYIAQKKYSEAISDYNKVIELSPKKESCDFNLRGKLFEKKQKHQEAFKDYTIAIELNPYEAEYYLNRGKLLSLMGKIEEAENDLTKAMLLKNPSSKEL